MAKRALRVTGFTRFFLVMVIVAPIAYLAASYYNGEDGIQNLKNLLGIGERTESAAGSSEKPAETKSPDTKTLKEENLMLKEELEFKSKRVDELLRENEELKRRLGSLEKVLEESKNQ